MAGRRAAVLLMAASTLLVGCRAARQVRDPEYTHVEQAVRQAQHGVRRHEATQYAPAPAVDAVTPAISLASGAHPVEEYIRFALGQNPDVQEARKRIEALAYQVPVEASLQDPMLNLTAQPAPVQTAAGEQDFILAASQKVPWFGKLERRASVAEAKVNVARAELAATELSVIAQVKRAYYQLYFLQQAIRVTEADQQLLRELRDVANTRYRTGQTSQQDVLRADLEISNVENELIQLRQQLDSAQARLARLLHLSPQTDLLALDELADEQVPQDLDWLQRQAVSARPELHARLAGLQRDRQAVELSRLEYKPDVTLGLSWISVSGAGISPVANGDDALLLTAGLNLPVYRQRLDSSVRSAEANAVASARQYDSLRDMTMEDVTDLFAQARSQQDSLVLFREDILPKARQTLEVSARAYNVGEVDFLQLIDNWRLLLRYEIQYERLQATLRQTLADLERVVGGFAGPLPAEPALAPPAVPTPAALEDTETDNGSP